MAAGAPPAPTVSKPVPAAPHEQSGIVAEGEPLFDMPAGLVVPVLMGEHASGEAGAGAVTPGTSLDRQV